MVYSNNKKVACKPFATTALVKNDRLVPGMILVEQKVSLTALEIVYGDDGGMYRPGGLVYVRGDMAKAHWAKEVFEVEGQLIILVPEDQIMLYSFEPPASLDTPSDGS